MKIIVFGANGPTGRLLTSQALDQGHVVTAFTRNPTTFPINHPRLLVADGDVRDADAVTTAVGGHDVVLSALGVPFSRGSVDVYSVGGRNIIDAMNVHGLRRLACVTSSAVEKGATTGSWIVDKVLQPLVVRTIGKTVYADMRRLEELLSGSDLCWTVLRPSGLCETPEITDYKMGERHLPHLFTSRTDLADSLLRQASDETWARRAVAVVTPQIASSVLQLVLKEGVGKKNA